MLHLLFFFLHFVLLFAISVGKVKIILLEVELIMKIERLKIAHNFMSF